MSVNAPALCSGCSQESFDLMDMSIHLHHVHLKVHDREQTLAFYEQHLKLQRVWLNDTTLALHAPPTLLLLQVSPEAPSSKLPSALQHVGFGSTDTAAWYDEAHAHDVAPDTRGNTMFNTNDTPTVQGPGSGSSTSALLSLFGVAPPTCLPVVDPFAYMYVLGPDEERIEVCSGVDGRINHVHITTADLVETSRWYQRFVGKPDDISPTSMWALYLDDVMLYIEPIGAAGDYAPTDDHVLNHIAFSVANLDAWRQRMQELNVEIVAEPAMTEGFQSFFVRGPDGMLLELVQAHRNAELCTDGSANIPPSNLP
jgi:catechol 2,3-dioxygenase-like lactoylglutathione lyase family enzyme